ALSQGADGPLRLAPVRDRVVLRAGGHRPHVRTGHSRAQALGRAGGNVEWPGSTEVAPHRVSECHPEPKPPTFCVLPLNSRHNTLPPPRFSGSPTPETRAT